MINIWDAGDIHPPLHYYGDLVRKLFFSAGFIMLITLPFVHNRVPVSVTTSLLVIIAISLFAGFTNPKQIVAIVGDFIFSLCASMLFGYYAVNAYIEHSFKDFFFWVNEVLAMIFFIALYFATKTFRARILER